MVNNVDNTYTKGRGLTMILGIDEAGRGPWAGPLVVGAVVLGGEVIEGLTDSKKLSKKRREELFAEINLRAKAIGIGWVDSGQLDEVGMSQALRLATRQAVKSIEASYHEIIIDGTVNFLVDTPLEDHVKTMPKADLLVPSVSAASIVAKVSRDRFMAEQDDIYPGYGFTSHAGYGTAKHQQAIEKLGVTPLHRLSFKPLQKYGKPKPKRLKSKLSLKPAPVAVNSATTRQIGDSSESVASNELIRRGHQIIDRNWKTKYCEIDIISQKSGVLYFSEVKHRKSAYFGDGMDAITPKKLNQMKFAARFYVHSQELGDTDMRLMAISTTGDAPVVEMVIKID